jgi:hypothetical protein
MALRAAMQIITAATITGSMIMTTALARKTKKNVLHKKARHDETPIAVIMPQTFFPRSFKSSFGPE